MGQTVGNFVYSSRYVYNSTFHESKLFETQHVRKLVSVYKFTKPHTLFSDVVKCGIVTNDRPCKEKSVTKGTIKKSSSRNSHGYGTHRGVKEFKKSVNMRDNGKTNCHDFNIDLKHRATM